MSSPVLPDGPLGTYNNTVIDDINEYNTNHSYISYEPPPPKEKSMSNKAFARAELSIMSEDPESGVSNPVKMNLLDNNNYTLDTATYNVAIFLASLKQEAQQKIQNNTNVLTESQGLRYVMRSEYHHGNTAFFARTHSAPISNDAIVKTGSTIEGFEQPQGQSYMPGLKFIVVDGYMNDNFNFFEGKSPKGGTSPGITNNLATIDVATNNMVPNNGTATNLSAQWTGFFLCNKSGVWTFSVNSDDCGFIWINNTRIASYGGSHGQWKYVTGKIKLEQGVYYPMKVQWGQGYGPYGINVGFYSPGSNNMITDGTGYYFSVAPYPGIAPSDLPGMIDGLKVIIVDGYMNDNINFFEGKALKPGTTYAYVSDLSRVDVATNNMIPDNSTVHNWSAQWMGYFLCNKSGTWTFALNSDDCSFLWVADTMIINNGTAHSVKEITGSIDLVINRYYPIRVQMAEQGGEYVMRLRFTPPGGSQISNGKGYYFSKPLVLHSFNQSFIPASSMYDHIIKFFSPTVPTMHANNNEVLIIYPDVYDAAVTTSRNMKDVALAADAGNNPLSIEWFGYFKPIATGTYTFEIVSPQKHSSMIWFGDTALVSYSKTNAILDNLNESGTSQSSLVSTLSGTYYPIRILYSRRSAGAYDFSVNIYMTQSSGQKQLMSSGDGYFCFLTDSLGKPYEPIQMAMALQYSIPTSQKDRSMAKHINHNNPPSKCYVSPVDLKNNFTNNFNLRATKAIQPLTFMRRYLTSAPQSSDTTCSMVLQADGNLIFNYGSGQSVSVTKNTTRNSKCATMCTNLQSDFRITNISVSSTDVPGVNLTGYFEITPSNKKNADTNIDYMSVEFVLDRSALESAYNNSRNISVDITYTIGSNAPTVIHASSSNMIEINNYREMTSSFSTSADVCHASVQANCAFTLRLTNSGNLSITTPTAEIWNSNTGGNESYGKMTAVDAWIMDLAKLNNLTLESASYATPFDPTPFRKGTLGPGGDVPYLYSPNGMYKLEIENGNLVIKHAVLDVFRPGSPPSMPNTFYLHMISVDEKLDGMFIANSINNTLRKITPDATGALNLVNSYRKMDTGFSAPPTELNSTGPDPRSYSAYANTDLAGCQSICNSSASCTHLYSYMLPNNTMGCMVNSDSKSAKYYADDPNSTIQKSDIYKREKTIQSTCRFSYPEYTTGALNIHSVFDNGDSPLYDKYNSGYSISTDSGPPLIRPEAEGACGNAVIQRKLGYLSGADKSYANYTPAMAPYAGVPSNMPPTESFGNRASPSSRSVIRPIEGFGNNISMPSRSTARPFAHLDAVSYVPPRTKEVEGMTVPGYNAATSCNFNMSGPGITTCIADLKSNIVALNNYSAVYHNTNASINQNYLNIAETATDINAAYPTVNVKSQVDTTTEQTAAQKEAAAKYEAIDYSGNLIYEDKTKHPQYMKDRMLEDAKQEILEQNTTYILSTMTVAALAIFVVMASR